MFSTTTSGSTRRGRRPASSNPYTVDQLMRKLDKVRRMWGGDTPLGVMLSGSGYIMPILEVQTPSTKARCTIIANFSESAQKPSILTDLTEPSAGLAMPSPRPLGPSRAVQDARKAAGKCPTCNGILRQNEESARQHRWKCTDCGAVCIIVP